MIYILMILIGIIIGMFLVMIYNIVSKKTEEKQCFQEYKEILKECLEYDTQKENDGKKKNPNKIRKITKHRR